MRRAVAFGLALVALSAAGTARAQDKAGAETLFQNGKRLFDDRRFAEACVSFAESYRLDPVSGALIALAACHEAEGRLATAWAEYLEVVSRARSEGKDARAATAKQQAAALEPKLAKLTVRVAPEAAALRGLELRRDGVVIGSGTFGTALPVDRGEHVVEAKAPGRKPFAARVMADDGRAVVIAVPHLELAAEPGPAPLPPATAASQAAAVPVAEPPPSGSPIRTVGLVAGVVGIVVMGVGGYFGVTALSKNSESNQNGCSGTRCPSDASKTLRLDAYDAGNTSTALFVVGGLLAAGGVVLYLVGGPSNDGQPRAAVAATPLGLRGSF